MALDNLVIEADEQNTNPNPASEQKLKVYVGIDESNHGKFPEVIVAAITENPSYSTD